MRGWIPFDLFRSPQPGDAKLLSPILLPHPCRISQKPLPGITEGLLRTAVWLERQGYSGDLARDYA